MENQSVSGSPTLEYFKPKLDDDAILRASMEKAVAIPSKSILFNIDQKADTISKTEFDAVLAVFVKVFNEMHGYFGKQGYVAEFERELRYVAINIRISRMPTKRSQVRTGRVAERKSILEKENISKAYSKASGVSESSAANVIDQSTAMTTSFR